MILRSEGGLIDWISVLVATVVLMLVNIRAIRRTAEKLEKEGFSAAFKTLFVEEKK